MHMLKSVSNDTLLKGECMLSQEKISEFLFETFLFRGIELKEKEKLSQILEFSYREFPSKSEIFSPECFEQSIGFVYSGSVRVYKASKSKETLLNTLGKGKSFGAAALFGNKPEYPTRITAKGDTVIIFLCGKNLEKVMKASHRVTMNYIAFLSEKIRFLNDKINGFAARSVEEKVAKYITDKTTPAINSFSVENLSKTASLLGIGRASLYRTLKEFHSKEIINFSNGNISALNREALLCIAN